MYKLERTPSSHQVFSYFRKHDEAHNISYISVVRILTLYKLMRAPRKTCQENGREEMCTKHRLVFSVMCLRFSRRVDTGVFWGGAQIVPGQTFHTHGVAYSFYVSPWYRRLRTLH